MRDRPRRPAGRSCYGKAGAARAEAEAAEGGSGLLEKLVRLRERVLAARDPEERRAVRQAWEELAGRCGAV